MPYQKKKTPTKFFKLNVRLLNTRSKAKYECLLSQKKSTKVSLKRVIRIIYIYGLCRVTSKGASVWSYASHRAQCGVTTCHSTCCGYHICFRLFACQILPCPPWVWKIHEGGLTQFSWIFFRRSGNMSG